MSYPHSTLLSFLILSLLSGCYPSVKLLYSVVPVEGITNWTQDHRNSFVFSCDDCQLDLDFFVVYESGDHIFLNKVEENPLLLNINISNKQISLPLREDLNDFSERSVSLSKNSELISLEDYREVMIEEHHIKNYKKQIYQKYNSKSYHYEYQLPEFNSENNRYRLTFHYRLDLFDSANDLKCNCSIPPLDFKIVNKKEVWLFIPGHSGPLF